jgi:hypothetical protein
MSMPLSDDDVAAIAAGETYSAAGRVYQRTDHLARLAEEVQATRQRRCGNCQHRRADSSDEEDVFCGRLISSELNGGVVHPADWFCADFAPQEQP